MGNSFIYNSNTFKIFNKWLSCCSTMNTMASHFLLRKIIFYYAGHSKPIIIA